MPNIVWSHISPSSWACGLRRGAALVLLCVPSVLAAQGSVTGQVTIQEKPGETTTDLGTAVVWVEPAGGVRSRPAATTASIAMDGRKFVPRVRVVTPGSKVDFPNQDPFNHNIFSNADGGQFDLGLYGRGETKGTTFAKAGAYPFYCNIHSKMTGWIVVVPTLLVAQAGADGRFEVERVPAGRYVLHVWHERAPELTREVTVAAAGATGQDVALDARGFKVVPHKNKFGQDYKTSDVRY
jgi:plastocyanin